MQDLFNKFLAKYNNKALDYDNAYGNQCFDLIQAWNRDWLKCPNWITGDFAYQIYGQLSNFYLTIPNTPDGVPQVGDIVVWAKSYNGYAGHTGVATGKGDTNTFDCFEQNDPTGSVCHVRNYNYNHVAGWLRAIKQPTGGGSVTNYKGYDLDNKDSMKVAVDVLVRVQGGEFVDKAKYDTLEKEAVELRKRPSSCPPATTIKDPKADKLRAALKEFLA